MYAASATSRVLGRVDTDRLMFAHPHVPPSVCKWLGIPALEDTVVEVLAEPLQLAPVPALQGLPLAQASQLIASPPFINAVYSILAAHRSAKALPIGPGSSLAAQAAVHGGSAPTAVGVAAAGEVTLHGVAAALRAAASALRFVLELQTHVVVRSSGSNVTRDASAARVYHFIDRVSGLMYVAEPPPELPISCLMAQALSAALGSPVTLPLHPLFTCGPQRISDLQPLLLPGGYDASLEAAGRVGQVGTALLPADAALLQLKPLKRYCRGEAVAYQRTPSAAEAAGLAAQLRVNAEAGTGGSGAAAAGSPDACHAAEPSVAQLCYGCVVADSQPSGGEGVYKVLVEVDPGVVLPLLSSNIFSFRNSVSEGAMHTDPSRATSALSTRPDDSAAAAAAHRPAAPVAVAPPPGDTSASARPAGPAADAAAEPVSAAEFATAVRELMRGANLPLDPSVEQLLQRTAELQGSLRSSQQELQQVRATSSEQRQKLDAAQSKWQCKVCMSNEVAAAFQGCGHTFCHTCVQYLSQRALPCPQCRKASPFIRIYNN